MDRLRKLFKKSPKYQKITDFLALSVKLLSFVGFEFEDSSGSDTKRRLKLAYYWIIVVNLVLAISSSAASILSKPYDIEKITYGLPVAASSLIIILKSIVLIINKNDILDMMDTLKSCNVNSDEKYSKRTKRFRAFVYGYMSSLLFPTIINIITPIGKFVFQGEKTFALAMKFPFDATVSYLYPFVLLWTSWNLINGFIIFFASDVLLYGFIRIISTEFDILSDKFENLDPLELNDQFKELVTRHDELYSTCKELNKIFTVSFFYKYIISSFVICFTAFQVSTSTDSSIIVTNLAICFANFNQIGLQCIFGQMLKTSSENVRSSIYSSKWEISKSPQGRKALVVCLGRSQKYAALKPLKFGEITLEQFAYILTSTYSYFTLLRQLYFNTKTN